MKIPVPQIHNTATERSDMSHFHAVVDRLKSLPLLSGCSRQEMARLVPYLDERHLQPGDTLFYEGQPAKEIWLLLKGTVQMNRVGGESREISDGFVGEEAAIGIGYYMSEVVAKDEVTVLALPQEIIPAALKNPENREGPFYRSIIELFTPGKVTDYFLDDNSVILTKGAAIYKTIGWIAAVSVPAIVLSSESYNGRKWRWSPPWSCWLPTPSCRCWYSGTPPPRNCRKRRSRHNSRYLVRRAARNGLPSVASSFS